MAGSIGQVPGRSRRTPGLAVLALAWFISNTAVAQSLEPRRWTHLPIGLNVVGSAVGITEGDISLDPVLRIEDATFDLYTVGGSYVRSFEWLGKSARIDIRQPYGSGRWEGLVDGEQASVRRRGLMDPTIRISMNLWGAPPLSGKAFMDYRAEHPVDTTVGASVSLTLPLGEYFPDRLINLGQNRYIFRTQLGVLHQHGPWQIELTGTMAFYQDNDDFYGGSRREQDPQGFLQAHVIRTFARGLWASLSGGYNYGGRSKIDGVSKEDDERTRYWSFSIGKPLGRQHSIKLTYVRADTNIFLGTKSNSLLASWSMAWAD